MVNSFQFTREVRLRLTHQSYQSYQSSFEPFPLDSCESGTVVEGKHEKTLVTLVTLREAFLLHPMRRG